jgi:hypothetical protein
MKKFVFETTVFAPSKEEAQRKMKALGSIGKTLSLVELEALEKAVQDKDKRELAKNFLGV